VRAGSVVVHRDPATPDDALARLRAQESVTHP
jgi:hypothetical protein